MAAIAPSTTKTAILLASVVAHGARSPCRTRVVMAAVHTAAATAAPARQQELGTVWDPLRARVHWRGTGLGRTAEAARDGGQTMLDPLIPAALAVFQ